MFCTSNCGPFVGPVHIQKIGEVRQKRTLLDIYNVHIQAVIHYKSFFGKQEVVTVTVGNLNPTGIEKDEA
jgi:hypothetical protein